MGSVGQLKIFFRLLKQVQQQKERKFFIVKVGISPYPEFTKPIFELAIHPL